MRLTKRVGKNITRSEEHIIMCSNYCNFCSQGTSDCKTARAMVEQLADYEDTEEQGRLVRLPCGIGADVYVIPSQSQYDVNIPCGYKMNNRIYHQHVYSITFTEGIWHMITFEDLNFRTGRILKDISYGKTWFTDREEAEKKLKEMEENSEVV